MYKLKEIPKIDRPRERIINFGAESLSNEELLSLLLKTGTKNVSVKELAGNILKKLGMFSNILFFNFLFINTLGILFSLYLLIDCISILYFKILL